MGTKLRGRGTLFICKILFFPYWDVTDEHPTTPMEKKDNEISNYGLNVFGIQSLRWILGAPVSCKQILTQDKTVKKGILLVYDALIKSILPRRKTWQLNF